MNSSEFQPIEPPPLVKLAGRPRTKRIRSSTDGNPSSKFGKLSKRGVKQLCSVCKEEGHNRVSCPNKGNQV